MNKKPKIVISILVLAMMAFSVAATTMPASALLDNTTLKLAGSSTVQPIAQLAGQTFPSYWNGLVDSNPSWGASKQTSPMAIAGLGSGTAFPAILPTSGTATADIGEMSRPPTDAEWNQANAQNAQIWAVGVDSVAIVYGPDMPWAPTDLTATEVAQLFESTDVAGNNPIYSTWGQFLTAHYGAGNIPVAAQAHMNDQIHRAVRDVTSGTYDCWNNFFGNQLGHSTINGENYQYMATKIQCQTNQDVYNALQSTSNCIGFISLGYLARLGHMIGVNIYNSAEDAFFAPSQANVIEGTYTAWRWLWEVTPNSIPTSGTDLEKGVWIAYMKLDENTVSGNPNFVEASDYIALNRADMAGGQVINSTLQAYTPKSGQTQAIPDLRVDSADFFYFVDAYVKFYSTHTYNPYADFDANGVVDSSDFFGFVNSYVQYYLSYNPSH